MKGKTLVLGASGLVGSAIVRELVSQGMRRNDILTPSRREVDLDNRAQVDGYMGSCRPSRVYLAAARVGGIAANANHRLEFLVENILIHTNGILSAAKAGVERLVFLGSSCIYPRDAEQPIREDALLSGALERTNEAYALAKIHGLKMCEYLHEDYACRFVSAMPTNLYGPGDNFHPEHSHVIPGLLRRFHEAKDQGLPEVKVWGSGTPLREFLHVEDLARALVVVMERYNEPKPINIGSGSEISIRDLAGLIAVVVGYTGRITFDASQPDGTPRKVLDSSRMRALGWDPKRDLADGLRQTYRWAIENQWGKKKTA